MFELLLSLLQSLNLCFRSRARMEIEILALRHQLNVLQRSVRRPKLQSTDRWLWIVLVRLWTDWRSALMIVKPETVIGWHRQGFRLYWTWKSRPRVGHRCQALWTSTMEPAQVFSEIFIPAQHRRALD